MHGEADFSREGHKSSPDGSGARSALGRHVIGQGLVRFYIGFRGLGV